MKLQCLTLAGAVVLSTASFAQTDASADLIPFASKPTYRGVYDAANQQLVGRARGLSLGDAIYNNDAVSGFFYNCIDGRTVIDEGLVPRPSTVGFPGTFDSYDLSSLTLTYVTDATDPSLGGTGNSFEIAIYESYAGCTSAAGSEAPIAVIEVTGAPGSTTGGLVGLSLDVDISGLGLCMRAEGRDGNANSASQRFGWSFRVSDNADASAGVGPFIAGDPLNAPEGDGTVFQNPGVTGTGFATGDFFRREGSSDPAVADGCFFFGGYPANIFGSFAFTLRSGLSGDCIGCGLGDDNFEENDDEASATPLGFGATNSLVQDNDADFFTFDIADGQTLRVDALFVDSVSDLDIFLRDDMGTTLDQGFTGTDNEDVQYTNCTGAAQTLFLEVDNFGGTCNEYDLILSEIVGLGDDALEDNDDCANAVALPLGLTRGLTVTEDVCSGAQDLDYYSIQLADGDTLAVDILFEDAIADLDLFAYDTAIGCDGGTTAPETLDFGFSSTDNENIRVVNTTGGALDIIIKVDLFGSSGNTYDMLVTVTSNETYGEVICAGNANSVGDGARLIATGSDVALDNALTLEVSGAPANQFGLFFASQGNVVVDVAGSEGTLCIGSFTIARFNPVVSTDGSGNVAFSPDLTSIPFENGGVSTPLAVMAGDTVNFQFWHRDAVPIPGQPGTTPTSNFSDAISVDFN